MKSRSNRVYRVIETNDVVNCSNSTIRFISSSHLINIYLVISLLLHLAFDSFLGLQDTLDRHVRMQATSALHLALIPFLGTLTFLLDRLSLHSHREAFLVSAILTSISLPFVNDAGFLFATRVRQVLAHGPLKKSFATLAAAKEIIFSLEY